MENESKASLKKRTERKNNNENKKSMTGKWGGTKEKMVREEKG